MTPLIHDLTLTQRLRLLSKQEELLDELFKTDREAYKHCRDLTWQMVEIWSPFYK